MRSFGFALATALSVGTANAALSIVPGATWTAVSYLWIRLLIPPKLTIFRRTQESMFKPMAMESCKLIPQH